MQVCADIAMLPNLFEKIISTRKLLGRIMLAIPFVKRLIINIRFLVLSTIRDSCRELKFKKISKNLNNKIKERFIL
jgi:hypothetical protein